MAVIGKVHGKLLDEVGGEFFDKRSDFVDYLHGYISATEIHLKKVRYVVPRPHLQFVCSQSPVLAYTSFQVGNVLIECAQQGFVFTAETLIGIAHHLCRDECLTV